ncbi:NFX1-type zinc finger-containing protein 1-like isoform X2 [Babylonia areolata]|uniref:NFX1-type zinc finger-containing protein 1-like isoform X2 n=1 Tax=Babylonia areolata TaxID=304850 RepID=UPI003FD63BD4
MRRFADDDGASGGAGGDENGGQAQRQRFRREGHFRPRGPRSGRGDRGRGRWGREDRGFNGRGGRGDRGNSDRGRSYDGGGGRGGGAGGRGFRGGDHYRGRGASRDGQPRPFPIRAIARIEDTDEATMRLNSQIEEFEMFMNDEFMSMDHAMKTLKVLSLVIQNNLQRGVVLKIMQIVCTSRFLTTPLMSLIQHLSSYVGTRDASKVTEVVESIHQVLTQVCLKLPSYASKGVNLLCILNTKTDIIQLLEQQKPELAEGLKELLQECQRCMNSPQSGGEGRGTGQRRRERKGPNDDDDIPPDDFAQLSIFPSPQDMEWNKNFFLRANKEEGAYRDANHYLDVQFRLLREDYIRPLRLGIKKFRELKNKGESFSKNPDLRLYTKVQIISMICKESLEHRLQFEMTPQLKRVRWQSSKRFLFGSLVCLTTDDFDSTFFAIVTNRDIKDLEKGIIQVRFESGLEHVLELSSSDVFTMAETTAYFEAYRHVLEGLREMQGCLPMSRYLVDCKQKIKPPKYLLTGRTMDLTVLLKDFSGYNASSVSVINTLRWPPVEQTTLNESQLEAVQTALSKELAIIQGPPGTGKTFVGLKVANILLDNRAVWTDPSVGQRPILVVCYTNHALDQFLEGILSFCPEGIVRVGSRCKTPQLEDFNLKNIRQKMRSEKKVSRSVHNSIRDCVRKLNALKSDIDSVSSTLEATTKGIVSASALEGYMLPGQYDSLMKKDLYAVSMNPLSVMTEWLSKSTIMQKVDDEEDPYPTLAKEVTSKILQGEGTCLEIMTDPKDVHSLPPTVRAKLYRVWLDKVEKLLQQDAITSPDESRKWLEKAKRDILPDAILQRAVMGRLFSAITQPLRDRHSQLAQFCVRAWLGVADGEPKTVISQIIQGDKTCDETQFTPGQMATLPRTTRFRLYRKWLRKAQSSTTHPPQTKQILAQAQKDILPDHVLSTVVKREHFQAITREMMLCHQRQSEYFIRSWLGVQDFCQNAAHLERLLDQLEEETDVSKEDEAAELNVEEEADVIQNSRQLDVDDDDDLFNFGKKKSSRDVQSAMRELGVQSTTTMTSTLAATTNLGVDEEGFSMTKYQQRKLVKKIKDLMMTCTPMTEAEAKQVVNLWSHQLSVEKRIRLYLFWLRGCQDKLRQSVKAQADEFNRGAQELRELRMGEDKDILQEATIVGMTTTGAARYRRVLTGVACPIIILEEAAEVLEAHVVTTLHKACQHLILIGDHQQLRPSPTVYELSRHYHLDLSLFERLVNNRLHHSTLSVQHRMRPEVARLVRHIYPELRDHGETRTRPHVRGMKHDVFLLCHEVGETCNDETISKSNQHEAELCVRLCRYLLQQGYSSDDITILTAYSGQVFALKGIMKKDSKFYQGVRVTAIDNYQGEENDIIILSLVRSNQEGAVGFLSTDNRVCVAISRARNGLFAIGNFKILAENSQLWKKICRTAKDNGQLGDTLTLKCQNHPQQEAQIITAKDFDKMPEGGCKLPCGTRLPCGHVCELSCHGYDREHKQYRCKKKCERVTCPEGHPCQRKCFEDCDKCLFKVTKMVPMCGHPTQMECYRDPHTWACNERCKGGLPCGHQCSGRCDDCRKKRTHIAKCMEVRERVWPCGHLVEGPCHMTPDDLPCTKPCGATLSCGHACPGTCGTCWAGRVHVVCKAKCGRTLLGCGHKCLLLCGTACLPCTKKSCGTACPHSACRLPCGEPCQICMERCPWKGCEHQPCNDSALCHAPCSPCGQRCPNKQLPCSSSNSSEEHPHSHPCRGLCGERCICFLCERKNFVPLAIAGVETEEGSVEVGEDEALVKLPQCGHIFKVAVLDVYVKTKAESLPAGAAVTCPLLSCSKRILDKDCWRYHRFFQERHTRFQIIKEDLRKTTTLSQSQRQKLQDSLATLTHDAEKLKSFASKANLGHVFKANTAISVNLALALTNQVKMAKVFETTADALKTFTTHFGEQKDIKDADMLQKILFKRTPHLTPQRLQELRSATRRFAYMTKLLFAKHLSTTLGFTEQINLCFETLKGNSGNGGLEEAEALLQQCPNNCQGTWAQFTKDIDVSSLDEPPEKEIPGLVTTMRESETTGCAMGGEDFVSESETDTALPPGGRYMYSAQQLLSLSSSHQSRRTPTQWDDLLQSFEAKGIGWLLLNPEDAGGPVPEPRTLQRQEGDFQ